TSAPWVVAVRVAVTPGCASTVTDCVTVTVLGEPLLKFPESTIQTWPSFCVTASAAGRLRHGLVAWQWMLSDPAALRKVTAYGPGAARAGAQYSGTPAKRTQAENTRFMKNSLCRDDEMIDARSAYACGPHADCLARSGQGYSTEDREDFKRQSCRPTIRRNDPVAQLDRARPS